MKKLIKLLGIIAIVAIIGLSFTACDDGNGNENGNGNGVNGGREPSITVIAGSGTSGNADGQGTAAQFNMPCGIAIDTAGNLYVADYSNHRIRKITPAGNVTTLAGSTQGFTDGQGTTARFYNPTDIAIDTAGNLYVTDQGNHRIRKITPSGNVTTFAGNGTNGSVDGQGTAAQIGYPRGITIDTTGNLYVTSNTRIRKITSAGNVTTLAGSGTEGFADGQGTAAQFKGCFGIVVDATGNLYVVDSYNYRIRKITPTGNVTTFAGSSEAGVIDGQGTAAQFSYPMLAAIDPSGNIFVSDSSRIRKISAAGNVTMYAQIVNPTGITLDTAGNIYVTQENHRISKITP